MDYINREEKDVKLGLYFLNRAYEISRDEEVLKQMHTAKKEIEEERKKRKEWFGSMFRRNSDSKQLAPRK